MLPLHMLVLVDDEDRRKVVVDLLRSAGHVALVASDARMAAEALVAGPGRPAPGFDAVVVGLPVAGVNLEEVRAVLAPEAPVPPDSLAAAERRQIERALAYTAGNRRQAARLLGIARSTLLTKIRRYA